VAQEPADIDEYSPEIDGVKRRGGPPASHAVTFGALTVLGRVGIACPIGSGLPRAGARRAGQRPCRHVARALHDAFAEVEGMKPLPHHYGIAVRGGAEGYAALSADGLTALAAAPPPEFDGPGDAWSPEQLLLAAVDSCFLFTLRAVARASRLDFISLELASEGTVDRRDGRLCLTEIVLRPRLLVGTGTDRARALGVLEKAGRTCLVSASLATPVRLEPEVVTEREALCQPSTV
jgi:organic hydroperoxide reductase OsmC/OhrA